MFDYRFNGLPNMLTAQMPYMPQNMLMTGQEPQIDPMATGAVPQPQPMPVPQQGDTTYFPQAPDANRAPIAPQDYQASLSHLQPPQATQQQQASPAPEQSGNQSGGGMQQVAAFLQGLGKGNGVLSAIGGGLGAVQEQKQQNQTVSYLTQRGIPEGEAQILSRNPQAVVQVLQNLRKGVDPKAALELQKLGYEVDAARLKAQGGGASATEYGLNPIWGQDDQGRPVLGVLGKNGSFKQVDTGGFDISSGTEQIDLGDSYAIKDKRSGQIIGTVPKNLANAERDKALGKAQGDAIVELPAKLARSEQTITQLDQLLSHDGLSSIVGSVDQYRPSWTMGASGRDALSRLKQLQGGAFLEAFGMLKGGGAITEIEGAKAEAAMARMDRSLSEDDFKVALKDFRDAVSDGAQKLRQKAGSSSGAPSAPPPQSGAVDFSDYFKQ